MGTIPDSPLGKAAHYVDRYDPSLLYPVERAPQRQALGLADRLPFAGEDVWTGWETSWLDAQGRPRVAILRFAVPCDSPRIVESKSVKLYLTSLNGTRFASVDDVERTLARDLSAGVGASVDVALAMPDGWDAFARATLPGEPIDDVPLESIADAPDAAMLRTSAARVRETLLTHLFRSVCPVTGQPDYAQVQVRYAGPAIERGALLAYLVAYRHHPGFHEHCVERIFVDMQRACAPESLCVHARFTRRGGLDINPWRSTDGPPAGLQPTFQQ